jgi:hypothetical protein
VTDTPTLAKLEAEVDRMFGLDAADDRPFGHLSDEELEAELARSKAELARLDDLLALHELKGPLDPETADAAEILSLALPGVPLADMARSHSEAEPDDLEALSNQAMAMFALEDDLVEIPRSVVEQLIADARSYGDEVELELKRATYRQAKERNEQEREAERLWPAARAALGWDDIE